MKALAAIVGVDVADVNVDLSAGSVIVKASMKLSAAEKANEVHHGHNIGGP